MRKSGFHPVMDFRTILHCWSNFYIDRTQELGKTHTKACTEREIERKLMAFVGTGFEQLFGTIYFNSSVTNTVADVIV